MSRRCSSHQRFILCGAALVPLLVLFGVGCPQLFPDLGGPGDSNVPADSNNLGNSGLTGKFVGSQRCATCHNHIHFHWSQTLHARAYETLEKIGQQNNAACIGCHTVGFGEPGGWVDRATTNDLAGVGCESCHGAARDHVENVADRSLRPPVNISSAVCGRCHTGSHHPNYDDWLTSGHANVTEAPAEDFVEGVQLNNCGKCHSGDFFYRAILNGETLADDTYKGANAEDLHAVECAICHNPHQRTGNAVEPEDGRDFQLRFPEVASPTPTNTIDAATNPARFNLCGQCHHSRGRTWAETSRPPHESVQSNVYVGEMPVPEDTEPLVFSRVSVHSFAREQCATCHMYRQDFRSEIAPAISGHTFKVNENSCASSGCHPSLAAAQAAKQTLQGEIQGRLDNIKGRLDAWGNWEYRANGGPANQAAIPDDIKKVRFLYYYSLHDGSLGIHNPAYVRSMLEEADRLLTAIGQP